MTFSQRLTEGFLQMGYPISDAQAQQMESFFSHLITVNEQMNLTAVVSEEEAVPRHFLDSAAPLLQDWLRPDMRCIDVGAGAGFPGIVLAILRPDLSFTLVDSLRKRVQFMQEASARLGLSNVQALHGRAEEIGQSRTHREQYDCVLSRAVASLPVLCEYCLPLAKPQKGCMIAYKGPSAKAESLQAQHACRLLGGYTPQIFQGRVPGLDHQLVYIQKIRPTPPKFPRKAGTPAKDPLTKSVK